jgi:signal transduction histidine kinase
MIPPVEAANSRLRRWVGNPSIKFVGVLLLALVIINAAAIWVILSSRRSAQGIAQKDFESQVATVARAVEAGLETRRGDFVFLSQSSPLANAPTALASQDPVTRRWGQLEVQGSLLLFLAAHTEVESIAIRDGTGKPVIVAGRRGGAPAVLPLQGFQTPSHSREGTLVGSWPLRTGTTATGTIEAVISVAQLFAAATPGGGTQFRLVETESVNPSSVPRSSADALIVSAPVRSDRWPVPVRWTVVGQESVSQLIGSVTLLANRYRVTVLLNLIVMTLAVVLGVIGFQQFRKSMTLEAENRQQARVRDLERQVLHSERLASVGRLAAGIAHEINNPLEGMSNYLSLLEEDLRAGRSDGTVELVGRVREGLERIAGIMRQVLTFSDPGSAPQALVDVNEILDETVRFVRANPAFRHVEVILRTPTNGLSILGNRVTLGQLFLNLLMNACQVQPDGGQVEVASLQEGDRAVVLVADCGPGIPGEVLDRIFEPFYSTRGSTGLGLSVCHGIVTEHRGAIRAENRAEGGAIFHVSFPLMLSVPQEV